MSEEARKEATKEEAMAGQKLATKAEDEARKYQNRSIIVEHYIVLNSILNPEEEQGHILYNSGSYDKAAELFMGIIKKYEKEQNLHPDMLKLAEDFVTKGDEYYKSKQYQNEASMYKSAIQFYRLAVEGRDKKIREDFKYKGNVKKSNGDRFLLDEDYTRAYELYHHAIKDYEDASSKNKTYIDYYESKYPDLKESLEGGPLTGGYKKRKSIRKHKHKHKWSLKYKRSINCKHPKGFSQRQHCKYGRKTMRKFRSKK